MKTELQGIRAFDALSRYHSVTAAANALNQPKSTISRRLAQLESELGQTLFIKQGSRLILTRAGEVFAEYCQSLLAMAEESQNALQSLKQSISGEVTILAPQSFIRGWLRTQLNQFLDKHSQVNIRLLTETKDDFLQKEPDIVLSIDDMSLPGSWRKQILGHWQLGLFASPEYLQDYPEIIHPKQLEQHQWLSFEGERVERVHLTNGQHRCQIQPKPGRLSSDNILLQVDSIANGYGIGFLPTWTANNYSRAHPNRLQRCLPEWHGKELEIHCYSGNGVLPLRVQTLLKALQENIPEEWKGKTLAKDITKQHLLWNSSNAKKMSDEIETESQVAVNLY